MEEEKVKSRNDIIHSKGFSISDGYKDYYCVDAENEYKRVKVGVKYLDNAILNLETIKSSLPDHKFTKKPYINKVIMDRDLKEMRNISNFYYHISGIYERICNYFAQLYRYDWYAVPEIFDETVKEDKILKDFSKVLNYLDNSYIKKVFGDIALEVMKNGCYYGYQVPSTTGLVL